MEDTLPKNRGENQRNCYICAGQREKHSETKNWIRPMPQDNQSKCLDI